ncbi:MAG TPA: pentapeptide repeat-containing protein [Longimicrobium sp.]|nr:pentapeptide repeat-containing protein [Longimicrobium sp.]
MHRLVQRPGTAQWIAVLELLLVLPPLYLYAASSDERRKQRHFQAWSVIAEAEGRKWSGGRPDALRDLNNDGEPLRAVSLAGAFLQSVRLPRADLKFARLDSTDLTGADLTEALITRTTLAHANFQGAILLGADFSMAEPSERVLFTRAVLCGALFIGASLPGADFEGARLDHARFDGADLRGARFVGNVLPRGASFRDANIADLRAPDAFVQAALRQGARLVRTPEVWKVERDAMDLALRARWEQAADGDSIRRPRLKAARAACGGPAPGAQPRLASRRGG